MSMIIAFILLGFGIGLLILGKATAIPCIAIGILIIFIVTTKSSNRGKLNELQSSTTDLPNGRCPQCSINISAKESVCPSCGYVFKETN